MRSTYNKITYLKYIFWRAGLLDAVIKLCNDERPHMRIGNLTPNQVHQDNLIAEKLWKNYYVKKTITVNQ